MTENPPDGQMVSLLITELRGLLTSEHLVDAANLLARQQGDWVALHIMAASTRTLGMLLAALSDPAELDHPGSLSCRITPGDNRSRPDQWQYELVAGRYPSDGNIVFSAKVRLPLADLPEVVARIGRLR